MKWAEAGSLPKSESPVESGDTEQRPDGYASGGLEEAGDQHEARISEAAPGAHCVRAVEKIEGPFPLLHGPSQMPSPGPRRAPLRGRLPAGGQCRAGWASPEFRDPCGAPWEAWCLGSCTHLCSSLLGPFFLQGFRWDGGERGPPPPGLPRPSALEPVLGGVEGFPHHRTLEDQAQRLLSFVWDVTFYINGFNILARASPRDLPCGVQWSSPCGP